MTVPRDNGGIKCIQFPGYNTIGILLFRPLITSAQLKMYVWAVPNNQLSPLLYDIEISNPPIRLKINEKYYLHHRANVICTIQEHQIKTTILYNQYQFVVLYLDINERKFKTCFFFIQK